MGGFLREEEGAVWRVECGVWSLDTTQHDTDSRQVRRSAHNEAAMQPMLPCSHAPLRARAAGQTGPRYRGRGARTVQRSCSCPALGRGTQNGDCLGL